jgi:uncharacterized protein
LICMPAKTVKIVEIQQAERTAPVGFIGLPDIGLVGSIATTYLVTHLNAKEVCYLDSEDLPPVMVLHGGIPKESARIYDSPSAKMLIAETPVQASLLYGMIGATLEWFKSMGVSEVYSLGGMPVDNRADLDKPEVFVISSSAERREQIKSYGLNLMEEGVLTGPFAYTLRLAMKLGMVNTIVISQAYPDIPDPEASVAALEIVQKLGGPNVDLKPLMQMADQIKIKSKEILQKIKPEEEGEGFNLPLMYG